MLFAEFVNKKYDKQPLESFGKYKAFVVDGKKVRDSSSSNEEFGDWDIHAYLPTLIPKNEIWIDKVVEPKEYPFILTNALHQLADLDKGISLSKAYSNAVKKERKVREIAEGVKFIGRKDVKPPASIYLERYGEEKDEKGEPITVWVVDGEEVRDLYKTDFILGGHGYVYPWIPKDEIWIEERTEPEEQPYIIIHELKEFNLMKYDNLEYNQAHLQAAKAEFEARENKPQDK